MMGQLDNRVAIITGAGWGIGKVIALAYAREGAKLVLATRPRRRPRLTPGSCVPRVPRWSGLQQGVVRGGAVWTGAAGWGRVGPQGCPGARPREGQPGRRPRPYSKCRAAAGVRPGGLEEHQS